MSDRKVKEGLVGLLESVGKYNKLADILEANIGRVLCWHGALFFSVKDFEFALGVKGCRLCEEFFGKDNCGYCPIKLDTKKRYCYKTPYKYMDSRLSAGSVINKETVTAVREEAAYLKGLLPEAWKRYWVQCGIDKYRNMAEQLESRLGQEICYYTNGEYTVGDFQFSLGPKGCELCFHLDGCYDCPILTVKGLACSGTPYRRVSNYSRYASTVSTELVQACKDEADFLQSVLEGMYHE